MPPGIAFAPGQARAFEVASTTPEVTQNDTQVTDKAPQETGVACNCWQYVKSLIPNFPNTASLVLKKGISHNGDVVVFDYPHYGIQVNSSDEGFWIKDSNWGGCGFKTHFIRWDNTHIRGYWPHP